MVKSVLQKTINKISLGLKKKAIVLCYHRVANIEVDPWDIAVSTKNFDEQLNLLSRKYNVVSVADLIHNFKKVTTRKTVCITFDDGYGDNFLNARPLLIKYELPACFFIASGFTGKKTFFWWDELSDMILEKNNLPSYLSIRIKDRIFEFSLDQSSTLSSVDRINIAQWKYHQKPPNKRCILYLNLWELFKPLRVMEQTEVMEELREWSEFTPRVDEQKIPMKIQQLRDLDENPLFEIALHTHNHIALEHHFPEFQEEEILQNQIHLKMGLNRDMNYISYPYGSYTNDSINVLKKLSVKAGFTSKKKLVLETSEHSQIGRYVCKDWEGNKLNKKLSTWFETGE